MRYKGLLPGGGSPLVLGVNALAAMRCGAPPCLTPQSLVRHLEPHRNIHLQKEHQAKS